MECPICLESMPNSFKLRQCTHTFHCVCVLKSMRTYLDNHGTFCQTVPCPLCRQRISYHIILHDFIKEATLTEIAEIINDKNIGTYCSNVGSLLHVAALFGRVEIIKFLLTKGLPIDEPNDFCLTPVYYAAVNGHLDTVKYMVENHQVNIDCETLLGTTMLDETIKRGYANVVEYLENKNAKRNMEDMSDYSSRKGKIDETIVNILSDRLIKRLSESI